MYVDNDFRVHINEKWAFPSALVGRSKKLLAQVLVTIARNGAIAEYTWVERSGNIIFDDSVEKAIKKANPAPPLPGAYVGESFQFGLIFTPPDQ
jgi:TonB family protein